MGFVAEILGFHMVSYTFPLHLHQILGVVGSLATGAVDADTCEAFRRNAMHRDASRVDRIPEADCSSLRFETWLVGWRLIRAIANFWSR